jgi:hypothetical protein
MERILVVSSSGYSNIDGGNVEVGKLGDTSTNLSINTAPKQSVDGTTQTAFGQPCRTFKVCCISKLTFLNEFGDRITAVEEDKIQRLKTVVIAFLEVEQAHG